MNIKQVILEELNDNNDDYAKRRTMLANKELSAQHIGNAMKDSSWIIRKAAVQHPNASEETIKKGLDDEHFMVRDAARERLK